MVRIDIKFGINISLTFGKFIGFVFAKRGISAEACSSYLLPKLVGLGKAQELMLTGRVFLAKEEKNSGLFNHVIDSSERSAVLAKALEIANEIANNCSPLSVTLNKALVLRNLNSSFEETHLRESKVLDHLYRKSDGDTAEGVMSFLEKRKPHFTSDPWTDVPEFYPWWNTVSVNSRL